ncbi:Nif11-like leader peptide family natural product precursor [Kutzneria sp. CA-103260]|uniref:Nif11-like leader peptide family natural product precursor n=1 Tax=Kutzneria sp. CA-103260 TaxID=2802641 RepID=UPI001BA9A666|nr:Nif11-like leader peptide family natural product precursor [Kutzneria sp. CA-103260]QUQ63717.1 Nif11 domain protein [Kutzneria sp. CA-103260]
MSFQACKEFMRVATDSGEVSRQLRAVTGIREIVALGQRHGYEFTVADVMRGSAEFTGDAPSSSTPTAAVTTETTSFLHHEYQLADIPGFEAVIDELPRLKIKPPSVDLDRFDREFVEADLRSTSMSPDDPEFQAWHQDMTRRHWRDTGVDNPPRRDFHLVNLDEHTDHAGYGGYFEAKTRVIAALENVFGGEVRFSGAMWYPPSSYRLWHTNENQPGWRMYVIDLDEPFTDAEDTSLFRYMNPQTKEIVTLREGPRIVRFFKTEQAPSKLFWHCIVNPTIRHRWSFGFAVPENWMERIQP